jgi:hypothetical protein
MRKEVLCRLCITVMSVQPVPLIPNQPIIEPERFAEALRLQMQELAKLAGVHRATITESPSNARLQGFMREAICAMAVAYERIYDRDRSSGFATDPRVQSRRNADSWRTSSST